MVTSSTSTKIAKKLGVDIKRFNSALGGKIQEASYKKTKYLRFHDDFRKFKSGTVIFPNPFTLIPAYPKIRRAILLEPSLQKHFHDFFVEEKLDGYNIRIVKVNNNILAISKGGLVCPYSTYLVNQKQEILNFLNENDLILCCELIGKESPYVPHDYPEAPDLDYFIFDIRKKGTGTPLTVKQRQALCSDYNLNQAPSLGSFTSANMQDLWPLLKSLESKNREGIVIKSPDMLTQMKYTLSNGNIGEIDFAFSYPFDSGIDFFFRRFIREAFQSFELNESETELRQRAQKLGLAILKPLRESIESVNQGKKLTQDSEIKGDPETLNDFIKYLHHLGVKFDSEIHGKTLKIKRIHQSTHDKIQNYLNGEFASD